VSDATAISGVPVEPAAAPALAWSEADDDSGIMPLQAGQYDDVPHKRGLSTSRPRARVDLAAEPDVFGATAEAWYRRPLVVAVGTALAVLAIGAAVLITLRHTPGNAPGTPSPGVSTTPAPSETTATQETSTSPPSSAASDTSTPASTSGETPTTTTSTEAQTTTATTTPPPERPDRPRFPRRPGDRLFPEPGQGGR
jgi:hypothetical protein